MTSKKENLRTVFIEIKKNANQAINKILSSSQDKKHQAIIKYQISCGGKRIRPGLAILTCRMAGGKQNDVLYPAAALEILHNYTLIVDDIIDHSNFRRKKPTVWKKYGKSIAECISMGYAASIFDLPAAQKNKEKVYPVLARTLKAITDGQILDILFEQRGREDEDYIQKNRYSQISIKNYFEMTSKKTASLLEACCEIGGICANATRKEILLLKDFGYNLGIAFQIQDDMLDMFGEEKKFGKKIGGDIIERKLGNIVMLSAFKEFSLKDKKSFLSILRKKKINNPDAKAGINLIKKTKAREKAYQLEMKFITKAKKSLNSLPKNKYNKYLQELTDLLVGRSV